jgi:hypothetical protein
MICSSKEEVKRSFGIWRGRKQQERQFVPQGNNRTEKWALSEKKEREEGEGDVTLHDGRRCLSAAIWKACEGMCELGVAAPICFSAIEKKP